MLEIEAAFEIPKGATQADFLRACGDYGVTLESPATIEVVDTYFDSASLRLRSGGQALRLRVLDHRRILGWKSLHPPELDGVSTRKENEFEMPSDSPPPSLDSDLIPLFTICQSRTQWNIHTNSGIDAEASWDIVTINKGEANNRCRILEIELKAGSPKAFRELAADLRKTLKWKISSQSKYEYGLATAGLIN